MRVEYARDAAKTLSRLDASMQRRIHLAIHKIPQGDIKPLKGTSKEVFRLRVGDWRVLFSYFEGNNLYIRRISPRGSAYKEGW